MTFTLSSPAFGNGQRIPVRHSRDGDNVSPPLAWDDAPEGTRSFVLVVEDPDAPSGTFRHWALYNIKAERRGLAEGAPADGTAQQAINDFGNRRYDGPQPPEGHGPHTYRFRLVALDVPSLELSPRARVAEVWEAASQYRLAETELVGTYER